MRKRSAIVVAVAALSTTAAVAPHAHATPDAGDLNDLSVVDNDPYYRIVTWGTGGYVFVTPNGVRCQVMTYNRANGMPQAMCWGALPGVPDGVTEVRAIQGFTAGDGTVKFRERVINNLEPNFDDGIGDPIDPGPYPLLPVGSKLFADGLGGVTCGVITEDELVCEIGGPVPIGFVLSPDGSSTF